jgi:hypothetical protein
MPITSNEAQAVADSVPRKSEGNGNDAELVKSRGGPLIVDGSINSPRRRRTTLSLNDPEDNVNFSASTSEDLAFDTPSSSDEHSQDAFESLGHVRESPNSFNEMKKHALPNGSHNYVNGQLPLRVSGGKTIGGAARLEDATGLTGLTAIKKASGIAWPLDRQLSSVEEIRTPSPRAETFNSEGSSPTGVKDQHGLMNGGGHVLENLFSSRPNGVSGPSGQGAANGGSTVWQTQKKKKSKRKTVKSENDAQMLNLGGGEALPADESLRKGG